MVAKDKILCWNYLGDGSKEFKLEMKHLMSEQRPMVLILIEPKVSGVMADRVCRKLGKKRWARSEAFGFSRGIWVLWNKEELEKKLLVARKSFLHMQIQFGRWERWLLMVIYANPQPSIRKHIWEQLDTLDRKMSWMLVGDYNCVLFDEE